MKCINFLSRKFPCIMLLIVFFVGLAMLPQYGPNWDEHTEQRILYSNIVEYCSRFGLSNYLDSHTFNIDGISSSVEKDHGIAIMYPWCIVHLFNTSDYVKSLLWHGYVYLHFSLSVYAMYVICARVYHREWIGLIAALMLFFSPRIFADGHYNNKDIMLLALSIDVLALLTWLQKDLDKGKRVPFIKILATSFAAGFVMNTKIIGIVIILLYGFFFILCMIGTDVPVKRVVGTSILMLVLSCVFYYILTPAMWGSVKDTLKYFRYCLQNATNFSRWDGKILFDGSIYRYSTNPPPKTYLIRMILYTTPIYISVFFIIGLFEAINLVCKHKMAAFNSWEYLLILTSLCLCVFPVLFATINGSKLYNGGRGRIMV